MYVNGLGVSAASTTASARATAPSPPRSNAIVHLRCVRAELEREAAYELQLLGRIAGEAVDGDDRFEPEALDDPEVAARFAAPRSIDPSPWCSSARTVTTSTMALGERPPTGTRC